jgi:hypothetical protein
MYSKKRSLVTRCCLMFNLRVDNEFDKHARDLEVSEMDKNKFKLNTEVIAFNTT